MLFRSATEVKVPPDLCKMLKDKKKCPEDRIAEILPCSPGDIAQARKKLGKGHHLDSWGEVMLALADGRMFDDVIKIKSRDRLILNRVWLQIKLNASVVRKMQNREGLILEEVAKVFGLTKERVRQIEAKVLRNISYHLVLP